MRPEGEVDVSDWFPSRGEEALALHPSWVVDPLMVSSSGQRFNKYAMSAAMLSNDQAAVGPVRRMQVGGRRCDGRGGGGSLQSEN